jgi:hypothetical protein
MKENMNKSTQHFGGEKSIKRKTYHHNKLKIKNKNHSYTNLNPLSSKSTCTKTP